MTYKDNRSYTTNNLDQSNEYNNLSIVDKSTMTYKDNRSYTTNNLDQSNEYNNLSIVDSSTMTYKDNRSYTTNNLDQSNEYNNLSIVDKSTMTYKDNRSYTSNNLDQSNEYNNLSIVDSSTMTYKDNEFSLEDCKNFVIADSIYNGCSDKIRKRLSSNFDYVYKKTKRVEDIKMLINPIQLLKNEEYSSNYLETISGKISDFSINEKMMFNFLFSVAPKNELDWKTRKFLNDIKLTCRGVCLQILSLIPKVDLDIFFETSKSDQDMNMVSSDIDLVNYKTFLVIKDRLNIKNEKIEVLKSPSAQNVLKWINEQVSKTMKDKSGFPFKIVERSVRIFYNLSLNQVILLILSRADEIKDKIEDFPELRGVLIYLLHKLDVTSYTKASYLLFLFSYINLNHNKEKNLKKIVLLVIREIIFTKAHAEFENSLFTLSKILSLAKRKGVEDSEMILTFRSYYFLVISLNDNLSNHYQQKIGTQNISSKNMSLYINVHVCELLYNFLILK
ncbi:hypothetical protein NGRA_0419 [Nosema granulosis]|uniref:Uncharacterized protein n=1 Tax=Nosema granulosis TaxID=83296 RepID=A0A9P6H3M9_9MICR|nr:hypothetical protein NGRA_0419 [Nosema granulosis]